MEVVFFYGILIGIAVYEIKRSQDASDKLKGELKVLSTSNSECEKIVTELQLEV